MSALEERIEADLALGMSTEVVPELEALVRAHPFRERLLAQLMLALYRAGRQAEALSAYQTGRRQLAEGLGLEPGPGAARAAANDPRARSQPGGADHEATSFAHIGATQSKHTRSSGSGCRRGRRERCRRDRSGHRRLERVQHGVDVEPARRAGPGHGGAVRASSSHLRSGGDDCPERLLVDGRSQRRNRDELRSRHAGRRRPDPGRREPRRARRGSRVDLGGERARRERLTGRPRDGNDHADGSSGSRPCLGARCPREESLDCRHHGQRAHRARRCDRIDSTQGAARPAADCAGHRR